MKKKPTITKKDIKKIIKVYNPKLKIISSKLISFGIQNAMYDIKLPKKEIILRICNSEEWWKIVKEQFIYELIHKKTNVPTPIFDFYDFSKKVIPFNYAIYIKINGKNLSEIKSRNKELIKRLGKILAKIHSIKFKGFGHIYKDFKTGRIYTDNKKWIDFFDEIFQYNLSELKKSHFKRFGEKILDFYKLNKNILKIKSKSSLIHSDYAPENILVLQNKIKGIIDFEYFFAGHNEYDLSWTLIKLCELGNGKILRNSETLKKLFLKEYEKLEPLKKDFEKRKKIYDLCHLMRLMIWNYPKQIKKMTLKQRKEYIQFIEGKVNLILSSI